MIFRLSSRQQKELLVRGTPLLIVLPAPRDCPETDADLLTWSRHAIREHSQYAKRAYREDICVAPDAGDGLSGVIGQIVHGRADSLCWWVDCVLVELDPPTPPRHPRSRAQWPGVALASGRQWPAALSSAGKAGG